MPPPDDPPRRSLSDLPTAAPPDGVTADSAGTPAEPPDRRFGDYELLGEIARGGMGIVYKARQVKLDRLVVVKMLLLGQRASDEVVERFKREAQAAARLRHPNIVAIHEVGEVEGQPFFSMDYVPGKDNVVTDALSRWAYLPQGPSPTRASTGATSMMSKGRHSSRRSGGRRGPAAFFMSTRC